MRLAPAALIMTVCVIFGVSTAAAEQDEPFVPEVGQPGKDVVWVPTPHELVEKMLDMAKVTQDDFLIDLGSGDGRIVIAAAKRGARALGIEYSIRMVELSQRNAAEAGVSDRATFVRQDMYEADISKATVLGLFLLPGNMNKLQEKFLALAPGTRIVVNEWGVEGWEPDERATLADCPDTWCTALLFIVPAQVEGTWRTPEGELVLEQQYQIVTGGMNKQAVTGRLRGADISFALGDARYNGRVEGNAIDGTVTRAGVTSPWRATRR